MRSKNGWSVMDSKEERTKLTPAGLACMPVPQYDRSPTSLFAAVAEPTVPIPHRHQTHRYCRQEKVIKDISLHNPRYLWLVSQWRCCMCACKATVWVVTNILSDHVPT
jgi:hypothetical protein